MEIFKKILGYLLLFFATILSIGVLATLPTSLANGVAEMQKSQTKGVAYFLGSLVGSLIFVLLIVYMVKKALKLIRRKKDIVNNIDEIGS